MKEPAVHPHDTPHHPDRLIAAFLLVYVGLIGYFSVHESSTWIHIATGEAIAKSGGPPRADPFTALGRRWSTESWLADLLYWRLHAAWGPEGLSAVKAAALGTAYVLMAPLNPGSPVVAAAVLALGANASWAGFAETPIALDLLMLAVFIRLLRARGRFRWVLAAAAPLEALWANLHQPVAVLGLWLMVLKVLKTSPKSDPGSQLRYASLLVLTALAWLATPSGLDALPRLFEPGALSPAWRIEPGINLYSLFLPAAAWGAWVILQQEFFLSVGTAALLGLSLLFPPVRPLFLLAACPTISLALGHALPRARHSLARSLRLAPLLILLGLWHWRSVGRPLGRSGGYGVSDLSGAVHFLNASGVTGRVFNDLPVADSLVGAGRPVFIDSRRRLYGENDYRDAERWASRWKSLDQIYRFDYAVLANRRAGYPARALDESAAWRLAYADDAALVYVKRSGANSWKIGSGRSALEPNRLWPDVLDPELADPRRRPRVFDELDRWLVQAPECLQALLWKAYALDRVGLPENAERLLDVVRDRDRFGSDPELLALGAFVLERRGRSVEALDSYQKALRLAGRLGRRRLQSEIYARMADWHRTRGELAPWRELQARGAALAAFPDD